MDTGWDRLLGQARRIIRIESNRMVYSISSQGTSSIGVTQWRLDEAKFIKDKRRFWTFYWHSSEHPGATRIFISRLERWINSWIQSIMSSTLRTYSIKRQTRHLMTDPVGRNIIQFSVSHHRWASQDYKRLYQCHYHGRSVLWRRRRTNPITYPMTYSSN